MEMVDKVVFRLSHLGQRNGNRAPDPSGLLLTLISYERFFRALSHRKAGHADLPVNWISQ